MGGTNKMNNKSSSYLNPTTFIKSLQQVPDIYFDMVRSYQNYSAGISRYSSDFYQSFLISTLYFNQVESKNVLAASPLETLEAYFQLSQYNSEMCNRALWPALKATMGYATFEMQQYLPALLKAFLNFDTDELEQVSKRQAQLTSILTEAYPQAIADIEPEFGFHFGMGLNPLVDETERFFLYQVMPTDPKITVKKDAKPIIILPPYVLGANILGFLPGENRSYAHCFANQGIPTYIRVLKDIATTEAVQVMTGEDDALDTQRFCRIVMQRHGKQVTLNGYCQGGFSGLCNILSGELDGLVDAFLTCVTPIDGTRSKGFSEFLQNLPGRFNDLAFGVKTLANGNQVADGTLMSWIYKLKSIDSEFPITAFHRDLMMFSQSNTQKPIISKTVAAINYWLLNERSDLPMAITKMSFASFNTPITDDGTLPVKLFGRKLNLQRIQEKKIPWLLCYGLGDDLVELNTALAPQDYIKVETTPFPKGHVAIATSWSNPKSDYALHTTLGDGQHRGPVRFQLDLDNNLDLAK
jgi:hypothetical protein